MIELYKALKPLRKKIILEKWIHFLLISIIGGIGIDIGIMVLAKWILIINLMIKLIVVLLISLLLGSLILLFQLPSIESIAIKGDRLGFQERFITAIEIIKRNDKIINSMDQLVIEDAINTAHNVEFKKQYQIKPPKKKLMIISLMIISAIVVGFTPSPVRSKLESQLQIKESAKKEIVKVEKIQENMKKDAILSSEAIKKINQQLNRLKSDLQKAKTDGDILRAKQKVQQELKKISKESVHKDLQKIGESLSQHELTRTLGDQLQKGNISDINKSLEQLQTQIKDMNEKELEQLANSLKETAKSIKDNPDLKQALKDYQELLSKGDLSGLQEQYSKLAQELKSLASQNKKLREAAEEINRAITEDSEDNSKTVESQSQEKNQSQGEEQGQGGNQEVGEGSRQFQGNTQTKGTKKGLNVGNTRGQGHKPNETIYSREAANKADYETGVNGEKNQSGEMHQEKQDRIGNRGESIPYQEVYHQYKEDAIKFLEEDNVPYGIKDLVEKYFTSLE